MTQSPIEQAIYEVLYEMRISTKHQMQEAANKIANLTALRQRREGWLPIDSAPEGKDILVYCQETGECFVVFWALQVETRKGDWVIARANDGTCFICKNPTHWQPLPPAPKESDDERA